MAEYYFNLPPLTQLTPSQQTALNEPRPISLHGSPGTGKSVVSMWRHIRNCKDGKASALATYTTTLVRYFSDCAAAYSKEASGNIYQALADRDWLAHNSWDEVIIDEAQDLPENFFTPFRDTALCYGADDSQILYPEQATQEEKLESLFPDNIRCVLDRNFRNVRPILELARHLFDNAYIPPTLIRNANTSDNLPHLHLTGQPVSGNGNINQDAIICGLVDDLKDAAGNTGILVPWQRQVYEIRNLLQANLPDCDFSYYCSDKGYLDKIKNIHVTTFKSAKGLEFDTVIMPDFHLFKIICGQYNVEWEDYYVGVTRARSNLHLISQTDFPEIHNHVKLHN